MGNTFRLCGREVVTENHSPLNHHGETIPRAASHSARWWIMDEARTERAETISGGVNGAIEAVVAILGPGHFFGEGCLNGHPLRIATATAADECVITRLEKATMIATVHKEPEFSELFMSYLLTRNSRID